MATKSQIHITKSFFLIVSAVVLFLFWKVIQPFAMVLLTAAIAGIIFAPLEEKIRMMLKNKKASASLVVVGMFLLVVVPLFFGALAMVSQAGEILQSSFSGDSWLKQVSYDNSNLFSLMPDSTRAFIMEMDIAKLGQSAAKWAFENIGSLFSSTAKLIFDVFIFFIALFYFLVDKEQIKKMALELSPFKDSLDEKILKRIVGTVRSVVFGALIVAIVKGLLAIVGLAIFGVPGSVLWGALSAIASQIPMIGATIILGPAVIYLFIIGHTGAAIGLLLWSVLIVGLVDNVLAPQLVGAKTKMNQLLILISILGGLQIFGPIGFITGPTILAMVMVVIELYKNGILE